ncbi:MAG: radical SAM family heme chaperone HemW [Arcanobacterium sp.]|nr:radical SAM family heme chaperone HemW [Arcanobacterium sp.]
MSSATQRAAQGAFAADFKRQLALHAQSALHTQSAPDYASGFSAYVHIPFCTARCGYCDFNTYTNLDFGAGASANNFAQTVLREIDFSAVALRESAGKLRDSEKKLRDSAGVFGASEGAFNSAAGVLGDVAGVLGDTAGEASTPAEVVPSTAAPLLTSVFFGGGTPTLLPARDLVKILDHLRATYGIRPDAEITVEANPESVNRESLAELKRGGVNRVSFGMQSAAEPVLAVLQRQHTPGQVRAVAQAARELGLEFSVDLIYGTPGESLADWRDSLAGAIALHPVHISAYALTVEPHTPMGRAIARGQIAEPDPDDQADKYALADELLQAAGYEWYEISNWAQPGHESRHNLNYWRNGNWWGYGPGAHSHFSGMRWWNVKHPIKYAHMLSIVNEEETNSQFPLGKVAGGAAVQVLTESAAQLPVSDGEILTSAEIREEHIMLGIRLREGIAVPEGIPEQVISGLTVDGLLDPEQAAAGRLVLTLRGRLLADVVTRALWG